MEVEIKSCLFGYCSEVGRMPLLKCVAEGVMLCESSLSEVLGWGWWVECTTQGSRERALLMSPVRFACFHSMSHSVQTHIPDLGEAGMSKRPSLPSRSSWLRDKQMKSPSKIHCFFVGTYGYKQRLSVTKIGHESCRACVQNSDVARHCCEHSARILLTLIITLAALMLQVRKRSTDRLG